MSDNNYFELDLNKEVDRFFDDSQLTKEEKPRMVIFLGGIAAGKTTMRRQEFGSGYVVVDAGEVFLNLCKDQSLPFPGHYEEAMNKVGGWIAFRAIEERRNIVVELIGADREITEEFFEVMNGAGYSLELRAITCDIDVAMRRNENRGEDNISCYFAEPYHRKWLLDAADSAVENDGK